MDTKALSLKIVSEKLGISSANIVLYLRKRGYKVIDSDNTIIPDYLFQLLKMSNLKEFAANSKRISKVAKDFGVKISTLVDFLRSKGHNYENNPMSKIGEVQLKLIEDNFQQEKQAKNDAQLKRATIGNVYGSKKKEKNSNKPIEQKLSDAKIKELALRKKIVEQFDLEMGYSKTNSTKSTSKPKMKVKPSVQVKTKNSNPKPGGRNSDFMNQVRAHKTKPLDANKLKVNYKTNFNTDISDYKNLNVKSFIREEAKIVKEVFFISFDSLEFKTGKITFRKYNWDVRETVTISILNPHLKEEFGIVKEYFKKVLDTQDIKVEFTAEIKENIFHLISATSPEISRIDESLIGSIRLNLIRKVFRKKNLSKGIYTLDKIVKSDTHSKVLKTFYRKDDQLLDDILSIENTKHFHFLRHLAFKQSKSMRISFLFKPFSFVFCLEGKSGNYVIWETLDTTEATYIWEVPKESTNLAEGIEKIELIIVSIKEGGKMHYIQSAEKTFKRIYHNYGEINDGFPKWRMELEAICK